MERSWKVKVNLDNFIICLADCKRGSGKERGRGVCVYINNRWCSNIKIHSKICTVNLEMLTVSLRPFCLPREFPAVILNYVYIPPSANVDIAAELVTNTVSDMQGKCTEAPMFITGDFKSCRLDKTLPAFQQYVDVPTRGRNTLDLCY